MKNKMLQVFEKISDEQIVIPDECGDSLWDAVLQQEIKSCSINEVMQNVSSQLNGFDAVEVCDATKVK